MAYPGPRWDDDGPGWSRGNNGRGYVRPRQDDIPIRRRTKEESVYRDFIAAARGCPAPARGRGRDAVAHGSGRQSGPGRRLGPSFLSRETAFAFRLVNCHYIVVMLMVAGLVTAVVLAASNTWTQYYYIQPCTGTCSRQQQERQQTPDDDELRRLIAQGCMLHRRVGIFNDTGSDGETAFQSDYDAQLRWADLDLREFVDSNVPHSATQDENGGSQQHKNPYASVGGWDWAWASKIACRGCLNAEQQEKSPSSMIGSDRALPRGLLESLDAYIRDSNTWYSYKTYFGVVHKNQPGDGGEFAGMRRKKRSQDIQKQCADCCWEQEQEDGEKEDAF